MQAFLWDVIMHIPFLDGFRPFLYNF